MDTSLSELFFKKQLNLIEAVDLKEFFETHRKESDIIEFKSYFDKPYGTTSKQTRDKEKIHDILKSICAFLNSEGGLLIWGSPLPTKLPDEIEDSCMGDCTNVDIAIEPDQFTNKVFSEISPVPANVKVKRITYNSETTCYIFEVSKSEYKPHQFKGTYYMRLDASTRTAPHNYVEALIRRISFPVINGFVTLGSIKPSAQFTLIPMQLSIHNLSKFIVEKNVQYNLTISPGHIIDAANLASQHRSEISGNDIDYLHYNRVYYKNYVIKGRRVIDGSNNIEMKINLAIWGETSPMITSRYTLNISFNRHSNLATFSTIAKENVYSFDFSDSLGIDEKDRTEKSKSLALEVFETNLVQNPFFQLLQ